MLHLFRFTHITRSQSCITYPIAKGTIINAAAVVSDPSLTGAHYEGHWVSDGSRDELVESFDNFEPDMRTLVKVDSLHAD